MKLLIVHYHLRPGGVRRIIELAAPHLLREAPAAIDGVVLASGEAPEPRWRLEFEKQLAPVPVRLVVEPAFRYYSEQSQSPSRMARAVEAAVDRLLAGESGSSCVVWAHNLAIGRNLLLASFLARACAARVLTLVAHHHDWWFDNRWHYWPEMKRCGFGSLGRVAQTVFPDAPNLHHVAINQADARVLKEHFPGRAAWLPNLTQPLPQPPSIRVRQARAWLEQNVIHENAPIWLLPARVLRRKNVAEALLLTRWLRPEAWLVSTAGISSAEESSYGRALEAAARQHHWPLVLGLLQNAEADSPTLEELLAVSEAVVMTSIQEGFGLPYLEAAAARRPLLARALPNAAPDLKQLGFTFPQLYHEILIAPRLFDWPAERRRQANLFRAWRDRLPSSCRKCAGTPRLLAAGRDPLPVPFSRLTLTAQLEVLAQPLEFSWSACAPLNPFLRVWRRHAQAGKLQATVWPKKANKWLSGPAYAGQFWKILQTRPPIIRSASIGTAAQAAFIRQKLDSANLFPLLWTRKT